MKESEFLDLMNGLDARYADETVSRLHQETVSDDEAGFTAAAPVRSPRRLFAGVLTAAAAAACVFTVTVLLPRLKNDPEVITPAAAKSEPDPVYEVDLPADATGHEVTTPAQNTKEGLVSVTTRTTEITAANATSTSTSAGQTVTAVTPNEILQPYNIHMPDGCQLFRIMLLDLNFEGKVRVKNKTKGPEILNNEQTGHILNLLSSARLMPVDPPDGISSGDRCAIELLDTDIRIEAIELNDARYILIDGSCYKDHTADSVKQVMQYADYCLTMNDPEFVIHLPSGYTDHALVYTITCAQDPIQLSNENTGYILKKMTEAKLTEIPKRDLPCGGPITVELEGTGIRWDIYTDTVVIIDGKYYEDSSGALRDIEMYALGFLGDRPE